MIESSHFAKSIVIGLSLVASSVCAQAAIEKPKIITVATYPHGTFLENLSVDPGGKLLFTSYMDRVILQWQGSGVPKLLAKLEVHPVAVLARANDIIVSAHGKSFAEGPAFVSTNQLLVLDRNGSVTQRVAVPDAQFLNGMVQLTPNIVLIADSMAAKIWRFDLASGKVSDWLADPLLGQDPNRPSQRPGANGLKLHDGVLYISNSARGALLRLRIANNLPTGALEMYHNTGPIDDFLFLGDGSIVATTHGAKLIRVGVDGKISDIMSEGCDSCTSVATFGKRSDLIVLTTGNFVEGGTTPARVLRVTSPIR